MTFNHVFEQSMLGIFQMYTCSILCSFNIAGSNTVNESAMFFHRIRQTTRIHHRTTADNCNLLTQVINYITQSFITAGLI